MKLLLCKTLWGHTGSVDEAAELAVEESFSGIEAPLPADAGAMEHFSQVMDTHQLFWVQEICTAGSYVPRLSTAQCGRGRAGQQDGAHDLGRVGA